MRSGAPAHRDLRHGGETGHRAQGPKEQEHPGHKGAALLHRRPGSVGSTLLRFCSDRLQTDRSTCCYLLHVLFLFFRYLVDTYHQCTLCFKQIPHLFLVSIFYCLETSIVYIGLQPSLPLFVSYYYYYFFYLLCIHV